ncbi:4a-hydroxytetrahydrobiopterin dehydratase [Raineyella antarctica]|uniref:Putative pterin-4-alpha-carbinolamine dehydratase n=1 Tax=Raineyella antarctica TaxID=1577474 RepID=A0A1G6HEC0_9ACTN|nr:VOC family protein [Raineyella antarctica]SDB92602.1 4a-hydroxytetrahydrobiopterin dehydratase [Raineyella antarctica]
MSTLSFREVSLGAPGWRVVLGRLQLSADLGGFDQAMAFVNEVAAVARELDHHPDIDIRYSRVHLSVHSHDVGALTDRDVRLAGRVSALLAERGIHPDHGRLRGVEVAIDVTDEAAVRPFWAAVLGYPPARGKRSLSDPEGLGPEVWFQPADEERTPGNRVRLDVWVAHDEARPRIARALAAGGRLVQETDAPSAWLLADPEGNEVALCTWQGREQG